MRKALLLLLLLAALSAAAGGLLLRPGTRFEFTDCVATGSSAQTLTGPTRYLFRVTDADVWVCLAESSATCASGGDKFPVGTMILLSMPAAGMSVACRSTASNGDAIFTRAD